MKAVILVGGQGLRLRPLTEDRPKAMIPINGRPIAELQISWLKRNIELEEIIFSCGHRWERLREFFGDQYQGIPVRYVVEEEPLGTGGGLKHAIEKAGIGDEDIVAMNGDVVTDLPLSKMVEWHRDPRVGTMVTMLLVPYRSPYGVVKIDKLRMVRGFEEKPEFPDTWINGGIYLMAAKRITRFLPEKGNLEVETFPKLVQLGEISAFPYYGFWRVIDSVKDLQELELEVATGSARIA